MAQTFALKPSSKQFRLLLCAQLAAGLLLWVYVEPAWIAVLLILLLPLILLRDMSRPQDRFLSVDADAGQIAVKSRGQPYFYSKYKVYACRWFAILKLIDQRQPRTLILNPDRFDNPQNYHAVRVALLSLDTNRAA